MVGDLDAALVEHTENMRMMLCIFSIPFPELAEVKTLRAAMQLWLDLEIEITKLLAEHAKGGDAADAVADAIEVCVYLHTCMHAYMCARARLTEVVVPRAPRPAPPAGGGAARREDQGRALQQGAVGPLRGGAQGAPPLALTLALT